MSNLKINQIEVDGIICDIEDRIAQNEIKKINNGTVVVPKAASATTATKAINVNGYYPIQDINISGSIITCTRTNNTEFSRTLPSGEDLITLYDHTVTLYDEWKSIGFIVSFLNSSSTPITTAEQLSKYLFKKGYNSDSALKKASVISSNGYAIQGIYSDNEDGSAIQYSLDGSSPELVPTADLVNVNDVVVDVMKAWDDTSQ